MSSDFSSLNVASEIEWIDQQQDAMVAQVKAWSAINSGTFNVEGLAAMERELLAAGERLGAHAEVIALAPYIYLDDQGNLCERPLGNAIRLRCRPSAKKQVLLCGHMDTVFAIDHPFQDHQYLDANTLNGPGVADMKGGLIVMLKALEAFERTEGAEALGWEVLLNPDEEIGSPSSAPLLAESAQSADVGLVFEPSMPDGTLAGERKGSGNFSLLVKGRAAHAGREYANGRNAIAALAKAMQHLDSLNDECGEITLNLGRIVGGGPVNIVPDTALCHFNVRVANEDDQAFADLWITRALDMVNAMDGFSATLHGHFNRPYKPMNSKQQALFSLLSDCGRTLGIAIRHHSTGGCCDGNNLLAAGLPNIDTLGVRGGNIHSDREYVNIDSFSERAALSFLLLKRLATTDFTQIINDKVESKKI